ncbi:insulinase family protein [Euhalothece natronophila Z-M001]|uniref:Insulinase family protein n=1 Tax=Euhalothece natronophila Z-M001 TaxID=522448 RepID=A0A5B8NJY9_9CHRO|nr:pitrilysin family protein [Euhalothece natronophila]QDZ39633.1 insulinase family protein [Euhalothece natronophila Z-M001]
MQTLEPNSTRQTIQRTTLDNGITLIVIENPTADIIAGRLFLKNAGNRVESPSQAGLSHLLSTVITKGTATLNAADIAEKIESVGAGINAETANDYFSLSLKTVSQDFPEIFSLVGEIMRAPSFPDSEVELEQALTLQAIAAQQEQPFNLAFNQLRSQMYPQHPYGSPVLGTEETVSALSVADLKSYHQTYFRPDNLVISLSGRITLEQAITEVKQVFGDWQPPATPQPTPSLVSPTPQPYQEFMHQETQQSIIMLGYLTASVKDSDYPILKLLNTYLGNGLSSRLFVELREKKGLAYDVSSLYPTRLEPSYFVTYMGTAPNNLEIAYQGLRQEVERLCEVQLTEEELQASKNKLLGQYALGKQSNGQLAQLFGWYETLNQGIEFDDRFQEMVAGVSSEQIQAVAQKYLQVDPYVSIVGSS